MTDSCKEQTARLLSLLVQHRDYPVEMDPMDAMEASQITSDTNAFPPLSIVSKERENDFSLFIHKLQSTNSQEIKSIHF